MWTDDGRTTEASHPISSPGAFGSGELKNVGFKGGGGGGGGNIETKTVCQTVKRGKIQNSNHLHNVKHVVQSTLQNM